MEFIIIKTDSLEWGKMWDFLREHPINEGIDEPCIAENNGEEWQYMGSFKNSQIVISEFRHRQHPTTNEPHRVTYQHIGFNDESISKSSRIK